MNYLNFVMYVFILKLVMAKRINTFLKPNRKILGGSSPTNDREFAFMAFITIHSSVHSSIIPQDMDQFCTGTIISTKHILTAAHCVLTCLSLVKNEEVESACYHLDRKYFSVLTGILVPKKAKSRAGVKKVSVHPEYVLSNSKNQCIFRYDISILELDIFLHFNHKITSTVLPKPVDVKNSPHSTLHTKYKECTILGWGITSNEYDNVTTSCRSLQKVEVQLINQNQCSNHLKIFDPELADFKYGGLCRDTTLCTYDNNHKRGIGFGDSGGPLICNGTQVGVVSWSPTSKGMSARENVPDLFSRTDINVMWIEEIMVNAPGVKRLIDFSFVELFKLL